MSLGWQKGRKLMILYLQLVHGFSSSEKAGLLDSLNPYSVGLSLFGPPVMQTTRGRLWSEVCFNVHWIKVFMILIAKPRTGHQALWKAECPLSSSPQIQTKHTLVHQVLTDTRWKFFVLSSVLAACAASTLVGFRLQAQRSTVSLFCSF